MNLIDVNICVTRARKLVNDADYDAIPEIITYYDRYMADAKILKKLFQEKGLQRFDVLAEFKLGVAKELIKCIESLNEIRSVKDKSVMLENDSFLTAVNKFRMNK